jgi:hypothetical protein
MNKEGLIKVRCINYIHIKGIKNCGGSSCVPDIMLDKGRRRIIVCREPVLVDWVQYIQYKKLLRVVEE